MCHWFICFCKAISIYFTESSVSVNVDPAQRIVKIKMLNELDNLNVRLSPAKTFCDNTTINLLIKKSKIYVENSNKLISHFYQETAEQVPPTR